MKTNFLIFFQQEQRAEINENSQLVTPKKKKKVRQEEIFQCLFRYFLLFYVLFCMAHSRWCLFFAFYVFFVYDSSIFFVFMAINLCQADSTSRSLTVRLIK